MQVRLKNLSKAAIAKGQQVRLVTGRTDSFYIASIGDTIVGTSAEVIQANTWGMVNLLNTVDWSDIQNKPTSFNSSGTSTGGGSSYMPSGW
jgi:hypothetical protein